MAVPTKLKIPFKPIVPLTYEAKGKAKMDDALLISSPKKPTTQNANLEKAKKPRKSKIFQPKYPSLNTRKGQNRQVYVPKEQLSHYKLHQGDEFRWVEHSTSPSHKSKGWIITK